MDRIDRADILDRFGKMTSVHVANWAEKEGASFGPMVKDHMGTRYTVEEAADFITKLLKGKVMHYDRGSEDIEFYNNFVVLEIHGQSGLRRRYVIVKDNETEERVCYLSWLA